MTDSAARAVYCGYENGGGMEKVTAKRIWHKKTMTISTSFFACIAMAVLMLSAPSLLSAQEVEAWFKKPANAALYSQVREDVIAMASQMQALGLSDSILASRLEEGARKKVSPNILQASLQGDLQRAIAAASILKENGLFPSDKKKATAAVEQILILMRAGTSEDEFRISLKAAIAKSGKRESALSRAISALSVVAEAQATYQLNGTDRERLALALIASDMNEKRFDSILASMNAFAQAGYRGSEALTKALEKASLGASGGHESADEGATGSVPGTQNGSQGMPQGNQGGGAQEGKTQGSQHAPKEKPQPPASTNQGSHGKTGGSPGSNSR